MLADEYVKETSREKELSSKVEIKRESQDHL